MKQKKILNLRIRRYIFRSYCFAVEVTLQFVFSIKDFFGKFDQIRSILQMVTLMVNFIFCAV